ncbi:MAG: helix-turn-helix transcriptional regulator [Afipia sp.]|nr:helix-turn-helix transcriptional regulator [Afipia sp.]
MSTGKADGSDRFMLISAERVFYAGLLGTPSTRTLGALAICVPLIGSARVEIAGQSPLTGEILAIPPHTPHRILADSRTILALLIEPESVADADMNLLGQQCRQPLEAARMASRIRSAYAMLAPGRNHGFNSAEFDDIFLGRHFQPRQLDPRIARVVATLQSDPSIGISGEACARAAKLSLSRFLHLFKEETGLNFRTFRAWKRGRNVLHHVNVERNLARFALDAGYPDSTHFSHSLRRIYGLQPSAIFSGSRRLRIITGSSAAAAAATQV